MTLNMVIKHIDFDFIKTEKMHFISLLNIDCSNGIESIYKL